MTAYIIAAKIGPRKKSKQKKENDEVTLPVWNEGHQHFIAISSWWRRQFERHHVYKVTHASRTCACFYTTIADCWLLLLLYACYYEFWKRVIEKVATCKTCRLINAKPSWISINVRAFKFYVSAENAGKVNKYVYAFPAIADSVCLLGISLIVTSVARCSCSRSAQHASNNSNHVTIICFIKMILSA